MIFKFLVRQKQPLRLGSSITRAQSTLKVPPSTAPAATTTATATTTENPLPPIPPNSEVKVEEKQSSSSKGSKSKRDPNPNLPLYLASFILGAGVAQFFPLNELAKFWVSEHLPPADSPYAENFKNGIETKLQKLPLYQKLYNDPDFESVRAWNYIDSNTLNNVVTTGVLAVPGGIAIKPVLFYNAKTKESFNIVHVGQRLCGYPFLIHGGILATLLDEIMKRGSSFKFGIDPVYEYKWDHIKTESIELQYKFPTFVNQFLLVKTKLNENGDIEGSVETIHGRLLVTGLGKYSKTNNSTLPTLTKSDTSSNSTVKTGIWKFLPF